MRPRGELAIVLHSHMPYVEGFGTWPFGEEWLWEAVATLVRAVARRARAARRSRCRSRRCCATSSRRRARSSAACVSRGDPPGVPPSRHRGLPRRRAGAARGRARALGRRVRGGCRRLRIRRCAVRTWRARAVRRAPDAGPRPRPTRCCRCSRATAGSACRSQTGIASHRRRFGDVGGRFLAAGVRVCAVARSAARGGRGPGDVRRADQTRSGSGTCGTCVRSRPMQGPSCGRSTARRSRSCGATAGIRPAARTATTTTSRRTTTGSWSNDGRPYDHERALALAREQARDFVARVRSRAVAPMSEVCACARSTPSCSGTGGMRGSQWLRAVVEEAARQGLALTTLDDALDAPRARPGAEPISGSAAGARAATCAPGAARRSPSSPGARERPSSRCSPRASSASPRALRELLALQASDWAFLDARELGGRLSARARGCTRRRDRAGARAACPAPATRRAAQPRTRAVGLGRRVPRPGATPSGTSAASRASGSASPESRRRRRCRRRRR